MCRFIKPPLLIDPRSWVGDEAPLVSVPLFLGGLPPDRFDDDENVWAGAVEFTPGPPGLTLPNLLWPDVPKAVEIGLRLWDLS